jgi:hypothetical protein
MKTKIEVGEIITLNKTEDAILWLVLEKDGAFLLGVKDFSKDSIPLRDQRLQWVDVSMVRKATKKQLRARFID